VLGAVQKSRFPAAVSTVDRKYGDELRLMGRWMESPSGITRAEAAARRYELVAEA
jgi:hypothetical protein